MGEISEKIAQPIQPSYWYGQTEMKSPFTVLLSFVMGDLSEKIAHGKHMALAGH